jgi:hypothetical protein
MKNPSENRNDDVDVDVDDDDDDSHRNSTFVRTRVSTSPSSDSRIMSPDGDRGAGVRQVSGDHRRRGVDMANRPTLGKSPTARPKDSPS